MKSPAHPKASLRLLAAVCLFLALKSVGWAADEIRTVAEIRALSPEQARQKFPVHLQAVVTFYSEPLYSYFAQDATAGIYLRFEPGVTPPHLEAGQNVEVTGTASPGEFAPVVSVGRVTLTGQGEMPRAKTVSYEQLASGVEDSQFVEIGGVVRSLRKLPATEFYEIEISTGSGRLLVFARDLPVAQPEELPDSAVRVRGVCSTQFNRQRQLFAIRLMVPRPGDLQVEVPAPKSPYDLPVRPIGSLLQFTPQQNLGHRVKVAGKVTYFAPGSTLYLQDEERGVQVQTKISEPLSLGDVVEVLGFVHQGDYTPMLQDAVYRKIKSDTPLSPARVTTDEALAGAFDSKLIQIPARLIDRTRHDNGEFLLLQESNVIFQANLKGESKENSFAGIENGSLVQVTGVCRIEPGEWSAGTDWRAKSFTVLLRSPSDVALLKSPPWWTLGKVLWFAGALAFVTLAAFGWVGVLHRQVAERTRELEDQSQKRQVAERRREIEQERARVAHDLHDELGARLTEVNMLTSLVKSPTTSTAEKERYLDDLGETSRQMVTSLDEIVWAVNPRNDTITSLASYFGSYAQRLLDLASIACGLDFAEDLPERRLDPKFRQEVFFAFKEALNNVVRHARARRVWVRIYVRDENLVVEIADDGQGMDAGALHAGNDGIANMKERMRAISGECEIASDAQQGTTVRFRARLPQKPL
ncbi:MAG: hypothetical protein C5B50_18035 [Verrucomicrobia bacterium]|nr:MAG: hypothetical protein C5B50_18035 [Verrucomicrobiota bacterium]